MRGDLSNESGGGGFSARALCTHCRSPLTDAVSDGFCCNGCRHVYGLLQDSGLARYYELRGERTLAPVAAQGQAQDTLWLEQLVSELNSQGSVKRLTLDVQGIQCGACVWLIDALFKRQPDAFQIVVNPALGQLTFVFGERFSLSSFAGALLELGYRLGPARKGSAARNDSLLLRTGICLALAANAMFLAAATYFGLESGPLYRLVRNAGFVLTTLSLLVGGSYFIERAYLSLRRGVLHLDLPIALGMLLAYGGSVWSVFFDSAQANYLDTVSIFIAVMLVGRVLQERLVEKNRRQLLASDGASGLLARRLRHGRSELTACTELNEGDTLLVCPGELLAVRGTLLSGSASCSLSWINGESEPRNFAGGEQIPAGAINVGSSALQVRAAGAFERSDLDTLLRDDGQHGQRLAGDFWDLVSRSYVLLVLAAAGLGVAGWLWTGASVSDALNVATAVLVVTCPCAFGIATPLAYELGVSGLRRLGLFVRDGSFFDRAARVRRIVFDKTGTLTTGSLKLCAPETLARLDDHQREVLYALTVQSNHPKSAAIARTLAQRYPQLLLVQHDVTERAGRGMECTARGVCYRLGEASWALAGSEQRTGGPVFSRDGVLLAWLDTDEVLRPDAGSEARSLRDEGYELWIATGDTSERARALAETLQIPPSRARGDLTPGDKLALLEQLDVRDTLMIGDGINDGPALSRALCSGTPAVDRPFVPARTDFYYLTPGLSPVRSALHVARAVRRVVRTALVFATAYNVLAVSLCYAGLMRPWLAALLMPGSSLVVLVYTALSLSARRRVWKS